MNDDETSHVQYGRTRIDYAIQRSPKRTTVAVAVDPIKGVMITAPAGVAIERLDRVVHDKAQWIVNKLREVSERERIGNAKEFVSGESFAYLGRNYRLSIDPTADPAPAKLERGWLVVGVDPALTEPDRALAIAQSIRDWYLARATSRLDERTIHWAQVVRVEVQGVRVKDQAKRWASCDATGVLRFNWRLIQAPMRLVDYVVAHEVVHLLHRDHTKEFWAKLGEVMPDYERRKSELRGVGVGLAW